jgi:hypothetical protein
MKSADEMNWWLATDGVGHLPSGGTTLVEHPRPERDVPAPEAQVDVEDPLSETFSVHRKRSALLCVMAGSSVALGVGWVRRRRVRNSVG